MGTFSCIFSLDKLLRTHPPSNRFVVRFVCHFRETENEAHLFCQTRNKETTEKPGKISVFSRPFSGAQKSRKCPSHFSKWSPHSSTHYWEERSLLCTLQPLGMEVCPVWSHCVANFPCRQRATSLTRRQNGGNFLNFEIKGCYAKFPRRRGGQNVKDILN